MTAAPHVPGPGHNRGPEMTGLAWRSHCWRAARTQLLPTLPIEVVRLRLRRAAELGLDYKTYAGVRASTGHDLVAFLFSSNALRLLRATDALSSDRAAKLAALAGAGRIGLATLPLTVSALHQAAPMLTQVHPAPAHLASYSEVRTRLRVALGNLPSDAVLLVGDHALEAEWSVAGRLAGYLSSDRYFAKA